MTTTTYSKRELQQLDTIEQSWDGDDTDVRFQDPKGGFVIGLRAKGPARADRSGFVVKA
jgi:hypothetical protein